jgi:hypothetical protein
MMTSLNVDNNIPYIILLLLLNIINLITWNFLIQNIFWYSVFFQSDWKNVQLFSLLFEFIFDYHFVYDYFSWWWSSHSWTPKFVYLFFLNITQWFVNVLPLCLLLRIIYCNKHIIQYTGIRNTAIQYTCIPIYIYFLYSMRDMSNIIQVYFLNFYILSIDGFYFF